MHFPMGSRVTRAWQGIRAPGAAIAALLVLIGSGVDRALAYEVSPMRVQLNPAKGQTSTTVTVTNSRNEPLPVEVAAFRRIVSANGEQELEPASEQFVLFPPQALIEPGDSQAIRVQYIGSPDLDRTASYVVEIQEVPVRPEDFTGVQVAYNFGVAVYVKAPDVTSDLRIVSHAREPGVLVLRLANSGKGYAFTTHRGLSFEIGGERYELSPQEFNARVSNPIVPSEMERVFRIALDDFPEGELTDLELSTPP